MTNVEIVWKRNVKEEKTRGCQTVNGWRYDVRQGPVFYRVLGFEQRAWRRGIAKAVDREAEDVENLPHVRGRVQKTIQLKRTTQAGEENK